MAISGDWIARDSPGDAIPAAAADILKQTGNPEIGVDTTSLGAWDSGLIALLWELRSQATARGEVFRTSGLPAAAQRLLKLVPGADQPVGLVSPEKGFRERVGEVALDAASELVALCTLLGETAFSALAVLRGRSRMQWRDFLECASDAGIAALPIVALVNFLVGGILAFVGAVQLRKFGAEIFVANLVGLALVREMAAVMTAIVMAGRTGGAYAAHLATMQGNEEIDALVATGIPVQDYLILPRVAALTGAMPLLYLYGCAFGLFGGLTVAVGMLAVTPTAYFEQTLLAISAGQFVYGFAKSIAFGALVAFAGCRIGLKAGRSAADVGHAATTAVVVGIVGVIALDAVFAVCANAVGF